MEINCRGATRIARLRNVFQTSGIDRTLLCIRDGGNAIKRMSPNVKPIKLKWLLRQRAKGKLTFVEFGKPV